MYSNIGASLIHFAVAYYLASYRQWDMLGIAIATNIHFICRFMITYGYVRFSGKFDEGYVGLTDPESFRNWGQ